MVKKPAKTTPTEKMTPKQARTFIGRKIVDKMEGTMDRNAGRDTRMSRDGGTNRRLKK
jgi:hypothetical protein